MVFEGFLRTTNRVNEKIHKLLFLKVRCLSGNPLRLSFETIKVTKKRVSFYHKLPLFSKVGKDQ